MSNRSCCSESSGGPPTTSLSTISSKRSFQEDPESQGLDAKRPRTEPFAYNSGETSNRDYQTNFGQDITVTDQASFRIGNDYHQTFLGSTQEDTKQALDHKKGVIVSWLSKSLPDVSKYHISACQKHEETTGSWLIQSDMLKSWMETGNSFLWLNAGAGTGKSVLCSTVIQHLRETITLGTSSAVIYWYFSFADDATQNISNFLCSVLKDLCSKSASIPTSIHEAYETLNNGQERPPIKILIKLLGIILEEFTHVYLVVDGLDEYPKMDRYQLLSALKQIRKLASESAHLFTTSRRELDIEQSFQHFGQLEDNFQDVKIEDNFIRRDIQTYINRQFENEEAFLNWTAKEKDHVKEKLVEISDGMFRLAALQIEELRKANTTTKRRKALENLPRSLDGFHKRLLQEIPEDEFEKAQKAFTWLAYSRRPLNLVELAEAVLINHDKPDRLFLDKDDRYDEAHDILSLLPAGLVRVLPVDPLETESKYISLYDYDTNQEHSDPQKRKDFDSIWCKIPIIQFAHFSVQEYLVSDRVAKQFKIPPKISSHIVLASACSAYLLFVAQENKTLRIFQPFTSRNNKDTFCTGYSNLILYHLIVDYFLLGYIRDHWYSHLDAVGNASSNTMDKLIIETFTRDSRLFSPLAIFCPHVKGTRYIDHNSFAICSAGFRWPAAMEDYDYRWNSINGFAYRGLSRQISLLLSEKLVSRPVIEDSMMCNAVLGNNLETVRLLVSAGFNVNSEDIVFNPLTLVIKSSNISLDILSFLIQSGARTNVVDIMGYPLVLIALIERELEVAKLLVSSGASVRFRCQLTKNSSLDAAVLSRFSNNLEGFIPLLEISTFDSMLHDAIWTIIRQPRISYNHRSLPTALITLLETASSYDLDIDFKIPLKYLKLQKERLHNGKLKTKTYLFRELTAFMEQTTDILEIYFMAQRCRQEFSKNYPRKFDEEKIAEIFREWDERHEELWSRSKLKDKDYFPNIQVVQGVLWRKRLADCKRVYG